MKKIIASVFSVLIIQHVVAQDDVEQVKNFRFGLKFNPSVMWLKSEDKKVESNGAVLRYGGGLTVEYHLAKVVSFSSGIEIDVDGGKTKYINDATNKALYHYDNVNENIIKFNLNDTSNANYSRYQLNNRTYNFTYITIPAGLKLKTKEIGMVTYFGFIGINTSVRWKSWAKDELTQSVTNANVSKEKLNITKDVNLFRLSLNAGLGGEINLSGSTSLLVGLNYMPSFTNVLKKDSEYIQRRVTDATGNVKYSEYPHTIKSNAIVLTVGILF